MNRLKQLQEVLTLRDGKAMWVTVGVLVLLLATGQEGTARQISTRNFEIAGVTLGVTTNHDLERTLGPAPAIDTTDHEGARRCYFSASGDGTVLEIESWVGTAIEFRLDSRPDARESRCAKSLVVSRKLATGSGLKLGLLRKQVMAILGHPTAAKGAHLVYEQSFDRPLAPQEEKMRLKESGPPWDVKSAHVMDRIEVAFSEAKVVSIHVLHNETD
jgi:hypothetical protein